MPSALWRKVGVVGRFSFSFAFLYPFKWHNFNARDLRENAKVYSNCVLDLTGFYCHRMMMMNRTLWDITIDTVIQCNWWSLLVSGCTCSPLECRAASVQERVVRQRLRWTLVTCLRINHTTLTSSQFQSMNGNCCLSNYCKLIVGIL